ncbi:MAG: carbon monoxide dehydrogenase subunit G, partial [Myxococcales bacterium]|nr:carbon monoxide dehydrogenase subunit G [Myxococcales bacterium]
MKLEGDFVFEAPVEEVWKALFDPLVLAAAMPGCEKLERVGEQYQGDLHIKVGPVQGKFAGKVDLKDVDEPRSYTMLVEGRGAAGFVRATAAVTLEPEGEATVLHYVADAQVGGKIASVGQRLLEASARAI